jgi:hypothetical protein
MWRGAVCRCLDRVRTLPLEKSAEKTFAKGMRHSPDTSLSDAGVPGVASLPGASDHLPPWCTLACPQTSYPLPTSPQTLAPTPTQTTTKPILPAPCELHYLFPNPFSSPQDHSILHKCLPTGGFLQTAVSDAPRTMCRTYLRSYKVKGRIRYSVSGPRVGT